MNEIEAVKEHIAREVSGVEITLEAPNPPRPEASWWLNLDLKGHEVAVEWKPRRGFGVTSPAAGMEGADEVYYDVSAVASRVVELLGKRESTQGPAAGALARLRQSRHLSQEDLAKALNVKQATVSKWERRSDMYVSTLKKAINAMGGELEIRAQFPERSMRINQFDDPK